MAAAVTFRNAYELQILQEPLVQSLLVANPLNRYLLNSPMLLKFVKMPMAD